MARHVIEKLSLNRILSTGSLLALVVVSWLLLMPPVVRATADQTVPMSVSAQLGASAHAELPQSGNRHISDDGRFVALVSFGTNLVPGQTDTNGRRDVFLYDRELDSIQLVSHSTAGLSTTGNLGALTEAIVSSDGAFVLFNSESTNLIAGGSDGNSGSDVFLWERATGDITLVSHAAGSSTTTGNSFSSLGGISGDGGWVAFQTSATDMVAGATTNTWVDVFLWEKATGNVTLVSHTFSSSTTEGSLWAYGPQISGDGAWIAFLSGSTNLISGTDTNSVDDVFLFETATGTVTLVSHALGLPTTTGSSWCSDNTISNDGSFVAFRSRAADLVAGDANNSEDIFLFEAATGTVSLVSHVGAASGNGSSSEPQLSGDGGWVAFASAATDLVAGSDTNGQNDIFLYEHASGTVSLVSHIFGSPTTAGNNRSSIPTLADDGSWVAYLSRATDLVSGSDANGGSDVFLFEQSTGTNFLVSHSTSSSSTAGNDTSDTPALAPGAASVFFRSGARDLVDGVAYGSSEFAFAYDTTSAENSAVSRVDFGVLPFTANDTSGSASISDDGRFTVFLSEALDLFPGQQDEPETQDVFLYDSVTGRVRLVSHVAGSSVRTGQQDSNHDDLDPPLISGDGNSVVFQSFATDLVGGSDTNDDPDLFLWDRSTGGISLISHTSGSVVNAANNVSRDPSISPDGAFVAFESRASDLGFTDANFTYDVFLWERATSNLSLVSHQAGNSTTTGDGISQNADINGDGSKVVFGSFAENLVAGQSDSNFNNDVFVWNRGSGVINLVSHIPGSPTQTPSDLGSDDVVVSRDGAYVAFSSQSVQLVTGSDTNSAPDVFLWQASTGTVSLVSHIFSSSTTAGDNWSDDPVIGDDGDYVTFRSRSTDLQTGVTDTNNNYDVYQWNRAGGTATLISHVPADSSTAGNGISDFPSMSGDGSRVAFISWATNLNIGSDSNAGTDVYRWDRTTNNLTLVSHQLGDPTRTGAGASGPADLNHAGTFVAFTSQANDLVDNDYGSIRDVFLFGDDLDTDLDVSMSVAPEPVGLGWETTWTIDVTNNGPGAAARVLVRDPLPAGVTFTGAGGVDWTCDVQEGTVACLLLGLETGDTAPPLEISGIVQMSPGLLQNTVTVTSSAVDPTSSNDSDSVDSNVQVLPPRAVEVTAEPAAIILEACQSTAQSVDSLTLAFSQIMSDPAGDEASDDLTNPDNYFLVSAGPDRDLQTTACGAAAGDDIVIAVTGVSANPASTEADLQLDSTLPGGFYRVFACDSLADDGGLGLDGDGDGTSGVDFSRQFRVDRFNLLTNGSFDCSLDGWSQVEEEAAEIVYDPADVDDAGASGSARALNLTSSELGLFQCLDADLVTLNISAFFRVEDATDLVGRFECTGYDQSDCTGLVLGQDSAETPLDEDPGVWVGLETDMNVPTGAGVFCGVTLQTPGGLPFEAFLDELKAQDTFVFADGFESGVTSAWSATVP